MHRNGPRALSASVRIQFSVVVSTMLGRRPGVRNGPPATQASTATGHRVFKIAAEELLGLAFYVAETRWRHEHEHVRRAALIYWHSRQWHCAFSIGSPSAAYRTWPQ